MNLPTDLDWGTFVIPDGWRLQPLDHELPLCEWKPRNGAYGYDRGLIDDLSGMQMFWSNWRVGMGTCYVLPAQTLAHLAKNYASTSYLFAALRCGFDIADATRIDLKIDIEDEGIAAHTFADAVRAGQSKFTAKTSYVFQGVNGTSGCTTYLGSKTSLAVMRVYDKNAESKGKIKATRIEVQLRKEKAYKAWRALCHETEGGNPDLLIREIIHSQVEFFGVPALDAAILDSGHFDFSTPINREHDAWRWLIRQVLPTFIKDAIANDGQAALLERFVTECHKRINRA